MEVLIVDDEPLNLLLLEALLAGRYTIRSAQNGELAYKMIEEKVPDIVLLDIVMPVMDGFTTLKKIKNNKLFENIIVIMTTAKDEKEDVSRAIGIGADDYVKKPIDATELYTKIDLHLKLRKQTMQLLDYKVYTYIHESMIIAQRIQTSLLPDKKDFHKVFPDAFTLYKPRDMVGGDLYFISQYLNKKFICVSDSTGHGVPAAMLSMLTYMSLNYIVNNSRIFNPAEVACRLFRDLSGNLSKSSDTDAGSFGLDAIFCEFNENNNVLTYSNVRRPMVIVRKNAEYLVINGKVISHIMSKDDYYLFYIRGSLNVPGKYKVDKMELTNNRVELSPGDMVYMYSDGITDQFGGPRDKKFSKRRFLRLLLDCQGEELKVQKLKIYQGVIEKWSSNLEQTDDIVVIGIKF